MSNNKITVNNIQISVVQTNATDYICISDIAKAKEGNSSIDDIIKNWLRNRNTLEFLEHGKYSTILMLNPSNLTGLKNKQVFQLSP